MANIAHSMDSEIIHNFMRLCNKINSPYVVVDTNHDCYLSANGLLLPILIKEAYRELIEKNYIHCISGLSKKHYEMFSKMSSDDFIKLLSNFNQYFIK